VVDISNSMLIAIAEPLRAALGCPINCTLQGENIFMEGLLEPFRSRAKELISAQLSHVDSFVAVSDYYAGFMSRYLGIQGARMHVVPLGVNVDRFTPAPVREPGPFTIGYLGRIAPEKGLHLLCDAYRNLRERGKLDGCRVEVAGYLGPEHAAYWQSIEQEVTRWGLADEIHYRGELNLDQKVAFLQGLDLFVVPAVYDDPKGMSLIEAMACGVPVVAPRRGSYTELLERTGGGVLVDPDDLEGLEETLRRLEGDRPSLAESAQHAVEGVREHYHVGEMVTRALDVYGRLTRGA
jgi:glycosyltransferase involved in cell wall biosynthesis